MQLYLLVASTHEVVDDVGGRRVAAGAAEPFTARKTSDHGAWIVDTAIASNRKPSVMSFQRVFSE